jgi:tRNA threonylcarbamoyl adenosine modification protein YjeE
MKYITSSAEETIKLGERFSTLLKKKKVFALHGELGSGKTTFTQGLAKGLGITKPMTSPTYIILRTYEVPQDSENTFYHVDLYRTETEHDVEGIGLLDLLKEPHSLFAIEWPEKMHSLLPEQAVHFYFSYSDEEKHVIEVKEEENAAGGVVVRKEEGKLLVALVHEGAFDTVVLPKGGVDSGESLEEAAKREVYEEAGISDVTTLGKLGVCERYTENKKSWVKQHFFLFVTKQHETNPTETDYVYTTEWFDIDALPAIYWKEQKQLIEENKEKIKQLTGEYYER